MTPTRISPRAQVVWRVLVMLMVLRFRESHAPNNYDDVPPLLKKAGVGMLTMDFIKTVHAEANCCWCSAGSSVYSEDGARVGSCNMCLLCMSMQQLFPC